MMAQTLMVGLDVGIYGRLATRDHILELAALAGIRLGITLGRGSCDFSRDLDLGISLQRYRAFP